VRLWLLSLVKKPQHPSQHQPQYQRLSLHPHLNRRQKRPKRLPVQKKHRPKKVKAPRSLMRLPQKKRLLLHHPTLLAKWRKSRLSHSLWRKAQTLLPTNC